MARARRSSSFLKSLFLAVVIHAGLFALLAWLGVIRFGGFGDHTPPPPEPALAVQLHNVEQRPDESPVVDERELSTRIARGVDQRIKAPLEQNRQTLEDNLRWLEARSSEEAIAQIASLVRRATSAPDRAYAPADPPPDGPFDHRTQLLYAARKVTGDDGVDRIEQTWVDKEGRTEITTFRRETNAEGESKVYLGTYQPDGSLFEAPPFDDDNPGFNIVVETVGQSPLLQRLFSEVMPALIEARRSSGPNETSPGR